MRGKGCLIEHLEICELLTGAAGDCLSSREDKDDPLAARYACHGEAILTALQDRLDLIKDELKLLGD